MKSILILAILLLTMQDVFASKEGVLSFSEFRIKSNGIGESGIVIVEGAKDASGKYKRLTVTAFGKTIEVSNDLVNQIPSEYQNGIQLSYEHGYKELGGRTIYIVFQKGFTSSGVETFIIAVSEDGSQRIIK